MKQHRHAGICKSTILMATALVCFMLFTLFTAGCSRDKEQHSYPAASSDYQVHASLNEQDTSGWPASFGFGRLAHGSEIGALDTDIRPDGTGLPAGSGDVLSGKALYAAKCAVCHGVNGIEGPNDVLIGSDSGQALPFGRDLTRVKTIGNYWPYATTVFDYIRRAMPYNAPGSLNDDEVYSLTAYLLYANKIIDSTTVMDTRSLPAVKMPAQSLFVPDDRVEGITVR